MSCSPQVHKRVGHDLATEQQHFKLNRNSHIPQY